MGQESVHPRATQDRLLTVGRAITLLDCLAQHPDGQTAKGLAATLGLSLPTTYHLLNTLLAGGLVTRDSQTRLFALGPRLPHLSQRYLDRSRPHAATLPYLQALAELTGETVHLVRLIGDDAVSVAMHVGATPSAPEPGYVGFSMPAHQTAAGLVLLAWQPPAWLQAYRRGAYGHLTANMGGAFDGQLQAIRERGYQLDAGENHPEIWCLAAPVFCEGRADEALAVIFTAEHWARHGPALTSAATALASAASAATPPVSRTPLLTREAMTAAAVRSFGLPE
ncbi:MAG: IclR family transcriptional regulator [Thermomicrobiales bacterium]